MRFPALVPAILLASAACLRADALADARERLDAGDVPGARAAFERLAGQTATRAEAAYWLGMIALRTDKIDEAIEWLQRAAEAAPKVARYHTELGGAYGIAAQRASIFGKPGLAKKCRLSLEKAVEVEPESIGARMALIQFYREAPAIVGGGLDKAFAQADEIEKLSPSRGHFARADILAHQKRYEEAAEAYAAAIEGDHDYYLALYGLGRAAAVGGVRLDAGEKALLHCLELTPAANHPPHTAVHTRLGDIARHRGDKAAARAAYGRALELDPGNTMAREALAALNAAKK